MSDLPSIESLELEGRRVFMRLDLNVPISDGVITSDARIQAALPSIKYALESGAHVALASHLGRPKGRPDPKYTLEPVAVRLSELLDRSVRFAEDCVGDGVNTLMRELRNDEPLLLQNLRYHAGEEKNDPAFARKLAGPFDTFVNDAFGACHRAHASIVGVIPHVEHAAAGYLLGKEVAALAKLLAAPKKGFVAVVGGAKVSDKIGVLGSLIARASTICIGGAMAYTFLKAKGEDIGASRCEDDKLRAARDIMERAASRGVQILLPVDHVVASEFAEDAAAESVADITVPKGKMALDIGKATRGRYAEHVKAADTVFWNGPMGVFEWDSFAQGTLTVAQAVAECDGYTVVGGGDSVAAIEAAGIADRVDHVSTGGGASIEYLEQGSLVGLDALMGKGR